ncbi:MAG: spermidine/putrescine ABC transporter substrate-binding protein [Anaerolineaceae bacterium]|nr:spermidine/putrescine ABC transporter substrate-binding protein [Anaerolineaceae bacterium]
MNKLTILLCFGLFALVMSVPVVAQESTIKTTWTCPEGYAGEQLNVFNWSTYIAENTVSDFETLCGVTVVYDVYDSDDSLLARLRQGNPGYDIVVPSDFAVPTMIEEGLFEPLNLDNIPNINNLSPDLRSAPYDPESEYTVPYLWGTFGIGYDVTRVGEAVTSWEQFFNYDGPVAWIDDSRIMLAIGLVMVGYDPNSTNEEEIVAAGEYLKEHSGNVVAIAGDDGQEMLARGEVDMVIEYNGDIFQLALDCECDDFAYVVPVEGTGFSSGFVGIPTGAQNHALAEVFIDYLLDPQVSADIANFTAYPTPNQTAIDEGLIDEALLNNPGVYPSEEARQHIFFVLPNIELEETYISIWDEVKIRLGG